MTLLCLAYCVIYLLRRVTVGKVKHCLCLHVKLLTSGLKFFEDVLLFECLYFRDCVVSQVRKSFASS